LSLVLVGPFLMLFQRHLLRRTLLIWLQNGALKHRKVIVITDEPRPPSDADLFPLHKAERTYLLPQNAETLRLLLKSVVSSVRRLRNISEVHLALEWNRLSDIKQVLDELRALPLPVKLIADGVTREILCLPQQKRYGAPCFEVQRAPLTPGERVAKR